MFTVFGNILGVFSITLIGFLAAKAGRLTLDSSKYLSWILIYVSSPCLVIFSMSQQQLTASTLSVVRQVILLMLAMMVVVSLLAIPTVKLMKVNKEDRGIYRMLLPLTNNGFMGYPLSLAVFGNQGLFLMIIANAIFGIYMYSVGVYLLIYDRHEKLNPLTIVKSIFSIPVIAAASGLTILVLGIHFPPVINNFLNTVGSMTIPLSMLVIGLQLSASSARELLKNRQLIGTVILRLIVIPTMLFLLFFRMPLSPLVFCVVVFAMSMPSAAVIVVLADMHGANTRVAAEGVFSTTLFSLLTIPIVAMLLTQYLGSF